MEDFVNAFFTFFENLVYFKGCNVTRIGFKIKDFVNVFFTFFENLVYFNGCNVTGIGFKILGLYNMQTFGIFI